MSESNERTFSSIPFVNAARIPFIFQVVILILAWIDYTRILGLGSINLIIILGVILEGYIFFLLPLNEGKIDDQYPLMSLGFYLS